MIAINEEMMMAATHALAELARTDVPEAVRSVYGGASIHFGRDYLIPTPFDHRVLFFVAPAVAKAAMESGVARSSPLHSAWPSCIPASSAEVAPARPR